MAADRQTLHLSMRKLSDNRGQIRIGLELPLIAEDRCATVQCVADRPDT
jgi:hypothetical protein